MNGVRGHRDQNSCRCENQTLKAARLFVFYFPPELKRTLFKLNEVLASENIRFSQLKWVKPQALHFFAVLKSEEHPPEDRMVPTLLMKVQNKANVSYVVALKLSLVFTSDASTSASTRALISPRKRGWRKHKHDHKDQNFSFSLCLHLRLRSLASRDNETQHSLFSNSP